jgi:signal transduction histidine kinase
MLPHVAWAIVILNAACVALAQGAGGVPGAAPHMQVSLGPFLAVLAALALTLAMVRVRGRRLQAQRRVVRTLLNLGEEVLAAPSHEELLRQMRAVLPGLLKATGLRIYVYNRGAHALEEIGPPSEVRRPSIPVDRAEGLIASAVAACFRNQTPLSVPDTRRSPFTPYPGEADQVRALLLLPMMAQNEVRGVLAIEDTRSRHEFSADEQMMAQHVANQAAIALRLMEEQRIREQLSRTERMAAAGQLLSGVAAELRAPVSAIVRLTESFLYSRRGPLTDEEMRTIAVEAERAKGILERLVSFIQPDRTEAKPVDVRALLARLLEFRRADWVVRGLDVREQLGSEPVWVLGSAGQLERVFLNLLMHAEQALADSYEKRMSVSLSVLARRALVEISYTAQAPPVRPGQERTDTSVLIEGVIRGIIQSHGGRDAPGAVGSCRLAYGDRAAPGPRACAFARGPARGAIRSAAVHRAAGRTGSRRAGPATVAAQPARLPRGADRERGAGSGSGATAPLRPRLLRHPVAGAELVRVFPHHPAPHSGFRAGDAGPRSRAGASIARGRVLFFAAAHRGVGTGTLAAFPGVQRAIFLGGAAHRLRPAACHLSRTV